MRDFPLPRLITRGYVFYQLYTTKSTFSSTSASGNLSASSNHEVKSIPRIIHILYGFIARFFQLRGRETYVRGTPIPFTADPSAFITRLDPTEQRRPQTKPLSGPVAEELPTISSQMVWTIWVISFRCLEYVEIASKKHIIFNIGHHPVLSFTCCAY